MFAAIQLFRVSMLHDWHEFFNVTATAGATLVGLLFVIVTLGAGLPTSRLSTSRALSSIRAFVTPTLVHFGGALFLSLVVLAPWPSAWPAGIILLLCGGASAAYQIHVFRMKRKLDFVALHWLDWIPYAGVPALANASLIAGAAGLIADQSFAPYAIASASTLLLVVGVYGAWDLTVWIVKNRDMM